MICPKCRAPVTPGVARCSCGAAFVRRPASPGAPLARPAPRPVVRRPETKANVGLIVGVASGVAVLFLIGGGVVVVGAFMRRPPAPAETQLGKYDGQRPTLAEAEAFAHTLDEQTAAGRLESLDQSLDLEGLGNRIMSGIEVDQRYRDGFMRGLRTRALLAPQIVTALGATGTYRLLRVHEVNGQHCALFRMQGEKGLNYHDLQLGKRKGQVVITDIDVFLAGETIGSIVRRLYISGAAEANHTIVDRLMGKERVLFNNLPKVQEMQRLGQSGDAPGAMRIYAQLPAELQREKYVLLVRVGAAMELPEAEYLRVLDETERHLQGDPALDLISLDALILRKKYDQVDKALDRLNRRVEDPWLEVIRGNVHFDAGRYEPATEAFLKAVKGNKDFEVAWWALVNTSLKRKKYADTARYLTELQTRFKADVSGVEEDEDYVEFVASPDYKKWKRGIK